MDPSRDHTVDRFANLLHYQNPDCAGWRRAPRWARFFVRLGALVGSRPKRTGRIVAVLATPTRGFAASLCGTGTVLGQSVTPVKVDIAKHLAVLRCLPLGAKLGCRGDDARTQSGVLAGFEEIDGREFVVVDIGGAIKRMIPAERCGNIEVMNGQASGPRRRTGLREADAGLVAGTFDGIRGAAFLTSSRLDCIIVAHEGELRSEVIETQFALISKHHRSEGYLQDILRVKRFGKDGDAFRSDLVAINWPVGSRRHEDPHLVVFDGANGYLRWGENWPDAHHIVVIDRREPRFEDAVAVLNAIYIKDRLEREIPQIPPVPAGVECMLFVTDLP